MTGAKPLLKWMDALAAVVSEGTCQLLLRAAQVCVGSLHAVAAVINTVADVVGCDWCSHRGEGRPENFGVKLCYKCGSTFR